MIVILIIIAIIGIMSIVATIEDYAFAEHYFLTINRYKIPFYKKNCLGESVEQYIHKDGSIKYLLVEKCKYCGKITESIERDYYCPRALDYDDISVYKGEIK